MNSKIIINIETNEWFIQLLNEYQRIILSCIGPVNGCLKLVSKSNDYNDLKLTSCSFNLFSILYDLKNCCEERGLIYFPERKGGDL